MMPSFFSYAKLKNVLTVDADGCFTMVEDAEPEDGFNAIIDIPKTVIQKPGLDDSTVPKLGGRCVLDFTLVKEVKPDIEGMFPMLPDHIMKRIKMETDPTSAEHME